MAHTVDYMLCETHIPTGMTYTIDTMLSICSVQTSRIPARMPYTEDTQCYANRHTFLQV